MFLYKSYRSWGETSVQKTNNWEIYLVIQQSAFSFLKKLINFISVKTTNQSSSPSVSGGQREKSRGSKGQGWRSTKGRTTDHVLALLEIQNKLIVEQDKHLQMVSHRSSCFLFVLNGQWKGNLKMHSEGFTGSSRHYSQNPWKKHHLLRQGCHHSALGGLWLAYADVPVHLNALIVLKNTFIIIMHVSPPACKVRAGSFQLYLQSLALQ